MGFVPAQRGRIVFDGEDITHEPPYARARRGLGYVPQGREIFPGLSVRDNLRMGFVGRGAEERIDAILQTFPRLTPLLDRRGRRAQRRRAAAAGHRALPGRQPQADPLRRADRGDPALDHRGAGRRPAAACTRRQALTIVLVEQNLEFIAELATRVLLIQKGTILRELQPGELRHADVLSEFVGVDRA